MKLKLLLFLLLSLSFLMSCDTREDVPSSASRQIVLRMGMPGSNTPEAVNPEQITDLSGYLFESGILRKRYPSLTVGANGVVEGMIVPVNPDASLYLMANVAKLMGESVFMEEGITTEDDFKQLFVTSDPLPAEGAAFVMTGRHDVSDILSAKRADFVLTRAFARLDVEPAPGVEIEKIVVNQVAKAVYLFEQDPLETPVDSDRATLEKIYESPLTEKEEGTFYFYEQTGGMVEVVITARIDGVKNELKAKLPAAIRRNHTYKLRVTKVYADIEVTVEELPWNPGETTDAIPDLTRQIKIDADRSVLSPGVRINSDRDTVFIPHYGSNFRLALEADAELEVRLDGAGGGGITVTPNASSSPNDDGFGGVRNVFDIVTELTSPGSPRRYLYLEVRNLNLSEYYGDKIVVAIEKSTTAFEGKITPYFNGATCAMDEYADGELGFIEIPSDCGLTCDGNWLKAEEVITDGTRRYKILGGYRPNDPEADGRIQTGTITVEHPDGGVTETYTVSRPNYGLPVVEIDGKYWCKFNLKGNARSFDDQIQITDAVAQKSDLYDYLKTCTDEQYIALMGDAYKGTNHTGLKLMYTGTGSASYAYRDYSATAAGTLMNNADATKQCPPGYQVPSHDDYDNLLGEKATRFGDGQEEQASYMWLGKAHTVYRYKRPDVSHDGGTIPVMYFHKLELGDNVPYALFGSGTQTSNTSMNFSELLFATVSTGKPNRLSQICGDLFTMGTRNINYTRTIRCIKSPVEFIY